MNPLRNWVFGNRIRTHVLYWVFIVGVWSGLIGMAQHSWAPLVNSLCYLFPQIFATYALIYYQLPHLLFKKKYLLFILSLIGSAYVSTVLARILKVYVYEPVLGIELPQESLGAIFIEWIPLVTQYLPMVFFIVVFTTILKLSKDHFEAKQQMEQLLKEKATAELNFLKAQIHPHFLFNTLNNLYTLTLLQSELAPDIVRKLSDLLEYMFYRCDAPYIPLQQEITLLQNYIDLELLRYGDRLELEFQYEVEDEKSPIAPLILLSLVENAFKHGASGDPGKPTIHIHLKSTVDQLFFRVFNTKPPQVSTDMQHYRKGIGVSNIQRQLELMYPEQYLMEVHDTPLSYEVTLELSCASVQSPVFV